VAVAAFSGIGQLAWAGDAAKGTYGGADAPKVETKKYDKHHKYDPKASLEHLTKKLNLTAEQKEKILPILNDKAKAIKELHQEIWDKKMKVADDYHAKVKELLTPEQQKKYDALIAKWKAECKKHHEKYEMGEHPAKKL